MKKAYKQIISAQTDIMAECYYVDEDGKRVHNDKFWIAPIVCFGLTENGDIESLVLDDNGEIFAPYIKRVYFTDNIDRAVFGHCF